MRRSDRYQAASWRTAIATWTFTILFAAAVHGSGLASQRSAVVKPPRILRAPRVSAPKLPRPRVVRPLVTPEQEYARALMRLYLTNGQRQAYQGQQTTRLLLRRVIESQQIVKHAGPGRERIEYTSPPAIQGEVLLLNGGRLLNYKPRPKAVIQEGAAPLEEFVSRAKQLIEAVRSGRVILTVIGNEIVAGQNAAIVEIRANQGGSAYKRFWIDTRTGVRLKNEEVNARGSVVSTSYFTSIDYTPNFDQNTFRPEALPNVPHEALLPRTRPLATVQAAQAQVQYPIREPAQRPGFTLNGVWVVDGPGGRKTTILRYTDGVNSFALFQVPVRVNRPPAANRPVPVRNGVAHWIAGDRLFTLISNLRPETVQEIVASLR